MLKKSPWPLVAFILLAAALLIWMTKASKTEASQLKKVKNAIVQSL
jgi:hypothetical protein